MIRFIKDGNIATVTLNLPDRLNALDIESCRMLRNSIRRCGDDPGIRAILLTGSGKTFCAGGDVRQMKDVINNDSGSELVQYMTDLVSAFNDSIIAIKKLKKPVIGAINGICSGGGAGLALACDVLVAAREAKIHIPNNRIGLVIDGGNSFFLPRMLGVHKATELFLTGRPLDAEEGFRLGIFSKVVIQKDLMSEAQKLTKMIASGPSFAMGLAKEIFNAGDFEAQLQREKNAVIQCAGTSDFKEGITAFFERRNPVFL